MRKESTVVVFVRYYLGFGGVEVVARQHIEFLTNLGYIVYVVCFDPHQQVPFNSRVGLYGERICCFRPLFTLQSQPFSFSYFVYSLWLLFSLKRKNSYIEVHHPSPLDQLIVSLSSFFKKTKLIVVFHSDIINKNRILKFFASIFVRRTFKIAQYILFTSDVLKQLYSGKNGKKSIVCPIISPYQDVQSPPKKNYNVVPFKLLFIGRLVPYKGLKVLLEAMKRIDDEEIELEIFGDGPLKSDLKEFIADNSLENKIKFSDALSDNAKQKALNNAHAFVLASNTVAEAFAIVQLEAMAHSLPVINTSLPTGVPWVSRNQLEAITVPIDDAQALADAMKKLKNDPKLYELLSLGANKRHEFFEKQKVHKILDQIFNEKI